jgi:hypothetical protein
MKIGSVGVSLNYETARVIAEAAHAAWNAGSLEGVLDKYVDDLWSKAICKTRGLRRVRLCARNRSDAILYLNICYARSLSPSISY